MKHCLSWENVFEKLKEAPPGRLYGVPRGGAIIAGLTGRAVDHASMADAIVDDIVDSGETRRLWSEKFPGKPFWALVDKGKDGSRWAGEPGSWVVFPWEQGEAEGDQDPVRAYQRVIQAVGEDLDRDGLKDTPGRAWRAIQDLTAGYRQDPGKILSRTFNVPYDEMVGVRGIPFWSLCEHHLLPFNGKATLYYIPGANVVGLSKIPRLVECFSRRLQVQERMTQEIAKAFEDHVRPKGVGVLVEAVHSCMAARGARILAPMVTSCLRGAFKDGSVRQEFLRLAANGHPG